MSCIRPPKILSLEGRIQVRFLLLLLCVARDLQQRYGSRNEANRQGTMSGIDLSNIDVNRTHINPLIA